MVEFKGEKMNDVIIISKIKNYFYNECFNLTHVAKWNIYVYTHRLGERRFCLP